MRNALFLLLLLAVAAVPGSVYPQRSADPNGVKEFFDREPEFARVLDGLQLFDVYTSAWFSAIYILLFVSLVGCVVPRTKVHFDAMRAKPVKTPTNLKRMTIHYELAGNPELAIQKAQKVLKSMRYKTQVQGNSVSSEKGYLKETGNLVFHFSLVGVLIAVGVGGGLSFNGQRVLVEGETFVNNLASYDSFSPGPLFDESELKPFSLTLDDFNVLYDLNNVANIGQPIDFIATATTTVGEETSTDEIRVNYPLAAPGVNVFLTGNGFAPVITVRDGNGDVAYSGPVIFLPQDSNMTSLGVIKAPDANPDQIGIIAFFYPTAGELDNGAYTSIYPDPLSPLLTMNVYKGDLGLDSGIPRNVYALDTSSLETLASREGPNDPIMLTVGESKDLPGGLGSVSFDGLLRFASIDFAYNPGGLWVLLFSLLALGSLTLSLLWPRRRVWVRVNQDGVIEMAALAKGDDQRLEQATMEIKKRLEKEIA